MGDIADMMLDGTLCEGCGEYLGDDGGFPMRCRSCASDLEEAERHMQERAPKQTAAVPKIACPVCNRILKITGIGEHWKVKHSRASSEVRDAQ